MSRAKPRSDPYQTHYADLGFERQDLFDLIAERYHPVEVLYPGCSTHLTPAFFFPHVVFVDRDPAAQTFFSDHAKVLDLVKRRKIYRRSPYVQFVFQDFTQPLPLPLNQFDLLLALFTGGVAKACTVYLKTGGFLLSNNHRQDAFDAAQDNELTLIATIQMLRGIYQVIESGSNEVVKLSKYGQKTKRYLRKPALAQSISRTKFISSSSDAGHIYNLETEL